MLQGTAYIEVNEGKARLALPPANKVFYNPSMNINRDLAVLFAAAYFPRSRKLRVCEPMTGSGVRTARYLLETGNIIEVVSGDRDSAATDLAKTTAQINRVEDRLTVVLADAYDLLSKHASDRFDLIDLDPFGSPSPFFESALRATTTGGVIVSTATDMGPLTGARPAACIRKYGVWPVRTEFDKELAVRTLVSHLVTTAAQLELGIGIPFANATDHYAGIYASLGKGRKAANQSITNLGYLSYCPTCLRRTEARALSSIQAVCGGCGASAKIGGPFWLGPLWNRQTVESMIQRTPNLTQAPVSNLQKILSLIDEELDAPKFYYTTGSISSAYRLKPPTLASLVQELTKRGHTATRTHFNPTGFRTDAPLQDIVALFRGIAEKA